MAAAIAEKIAMLGGIITSPLPLRPGTPLRFSVSDDTRGALLQQLQTFGMCLHSCGSETRFMPVGINHLPADMAVFELDIPRERPPDGKKESR
jgi:hypothetical protein